MLKLIYSMAELNTEQLIDIYKEQKFDEIDFLSYLREDFFRQQGSFYAVWIVDDMYKSAVRFEPYRDGLLLHALETEPRERRKGYAYNLLKQVLSHLQKMEVKAVYSHIDKRNKSSLELHKKCGFAIIADTATYIDGTVTQRSYTAQIRL